MLVAMKLNSAIRLMKYMCAVSTFGFSISYSCFRYLTWNVKTSFKWMKYRAVEFEISVHMSFPSYTI